MEAARKRLALQEQEAKRAKAEAEATAEAVATEKLRKQQVLKAKAEAARLAREALLAKEREAFFGTSNSSNPLGKMKDPYLVIKYHGGGHTDAGEQAAKELRLKQQSALKSESTQADTKRAKQADTSRAKQPDTERETIKKRKIF